MQSSNLRKVPLDTILKQNIWTPESINRVLCFAAYQNDTTLFGSTVHNAQVTKQGMAATGWEPLFVAARNNSVQIIGQVEDNFGPLDDVVRNTMMEEAVACNALGVVQVYATGSELHDIPGAVHTAITYKYTDTLHHLFSCQTRVELDYLHETGVIQRLVEHRMWTLVRVLLEKGDTGR